jgi:hypothetical protein
MLPAVALVPTVPTVVVTVTDSLFAAPAAVKVFTVIYALGVVEAVARATVAASATLPVDALLMKAVAEPVVVDGAETVIAEVAVIVSLPVVPFQAVTSTVYVPATAVAEARVM